MQQGLFPITKAVSEQKDCYDFWIGCPSIAQQARAGQFLHILCGEKTLRRPISICEIRGDSLRIVFQVRGEGTAWLAGRQAGESLDILGPCGNGFPDVSGQTILVVGGGIGVPPLLELCKQAKSATAILGFRSRDAVILETDFQQNCDTCFLTTDDGSYKRQGFVTDVMRELLLQGRFDSIYSCGPGAMLKQVSLIARQQGIPCYVSLEERMGCGVGACLVCACAVRKETETVHLHVCKDGPVFNAEEVVFA